MNCIQERLAKHRVAIYCIVTFAASRGPSGSPRCIRALCPLWRRERVSSPIPLRSCWWEQACSSLRLVWWSRALLRAKAFHNVWTKPVQFRRTWKYYVAGWLSPIALVAVGGAAYFLLNPSQFDPSMPLFVEATQHQLEVSGQAASLDAAQIRMLGYAQLALVLVAPLLNCITCFGEEWGWRGYLLPHLMEKRSITFSVVVGGIIWGLWHAPITALGHNYGLDYPGWPILGHRGDVLFLRGLELPVQLAYPACEKLSASRVRSRCCEQLHLGADHVPSRSGESLRRPTATGIVGGIGFIVVAILCLRALRKRQR